MVKEQAKGLGIDTMIRIQYFREKWKIRSLSLLYFTLSPLLYCIEEYPRAVDRQ